MRLFVSLDLDGLTEAIQPVQQLLADADGLRFTDPSQAHVTLKFLGDTNPDRLPELTTALQQAIVESGVGSFRAAFGGLGVFPSLDYISVVWVGVRAGGDQMTRLHNAIETRTTAMGFEPEEHEFTPHATIARMDHAGGKNLVQSTVRDRDPDVGGMTVEEVTLKKSELGENGPEYTTVESFSLPERPQK